MASQVQGVITDGNFETIKERLDEIIRVVQYPSFKASIESHDSVLFRYYGHQDNDKNFDLVHSDFQVEILVLCDPSSLRTLDFVTTDNEREEDDELAEIREIFAEGEALSNSVVQNDKIIYDAQVFTKILDKVEKLLRYDIDNLLVKSNVEYVIDSMKEMRKVDQIEPNIKKRINMLIKQFSEQGAGAKKHQSDNFYGLLERFESIKTYKKDKENENSNEKVILYSNNKTEEYSDLIESIEKIQVSYLSNEEYQDLVQILETLVHVKELPKDQVAYYQDYLEDIRSLRLECNIQWYFQPQYDFKFVHRFMYDWSKKKYGNKNTSYLTALLRKRKPTIEKITRLSKKQFLLRGKNLNVSRKLNPQYMKVLIQSSDKSSAAKIVTDSKDMLIVDAEQEIKAKSIHFIIKSFSNELLAYKEYKENFVPPKPAEIKKLTGKLIETYLFLDLHVSEVVPNTIKKIAIFDRVIDITSPVEIKWRSKDKNNSFLIIRLDQFVTNKQKEMEVVLKILGNENKPLGEKTITVKR